MKYKQLTILKKIEELALYLVVFIHIRQMKEKAFLPVMRSDSAVAIGRTEPLLAVWGLVCFETLVGQKC